MSDSPRRIIGATLGGGLGVLIYWLALHNGFHILAAVALGPGVGSGLVARRRSLAWGVAIGIVSVAFTIVIEWLFLPFTADGSLGYFLTHVGDLSLKSQLSIIAAAAIGFYFGMGRNPRKKGEQSV